MSKPFLIIQLRPEDLAANDEFEAFKRYGKLADSEVVRIRAEEKGLPEIDLDQYSAIIVGGSPFDISTPQNEKSEIQVKVEADFVRLLGDVVPRDFPFIGCCSGNGQVGNFCGADITKTYGEPVGGVDITLTAAGENDPILKGVEKRFRALVGHKEACEAVPPESVLLASSETCPVQMFRVGQNVYATQFHPEATPATFELRINVYKNAGYFPPESAQDLIDAVKDEIITQPQKILENFVAKYRV